MITSTHNPRIQQVRTLLGKARDRREAGAFVVEGVRLVEEAAAAGWPFRYLLAGESLSERGQALVEMLKRRNIAVETVSQSVLDSAADTETTQGILAVVEYKQLPLPEKLDFVFIPDQVRDPGNLGTLIRSAAAAGAQAVFLPPETTDAFAPKVVRAGMGAHFRLPILGMDWAQIRERTSGLQVYLAEMEAELSCYQADFCASLALVVGGEAEGASQPARDLATRQVHIPMPGRAESLNAAVAGAILLFEVVRQRQSIRA
jgi:RNA methyltransferase, TrmH family